MDTEEWALWQKHFPEVLDWTSRARAPAGSPGRGACLDAVEMRAFSLNADALSRFRAVITAVPFHHFEDHELELVIRIFLQARTGRHGDLVLGETGRRLLAAAEKRGEVRDSYLAPFRELVHAELGATD